MDVVAKIPEEDWMAKREEFRAEHSRPGAREELMQGLKSWLASDFHKQRSKSSTVIPANTKVVFVED